MPQAWSRIIAHADMDAFYASVEQLDDPRLRGKPVLVGPRSRRGVVLTASYEARPFGVGSAMPMAKALQLCPRALVVPPRLQRYVELSERIVRRLQDFSPLVEPLSLDEAFVELSGTTHLFGPPAAMGQAIKAAISEATGGLSASVGVATTKYVAKVASAHGKPDAVTVVGPGQAAGWLAAMPVSSLWGAGPRTQSRLKAMGLHTIGAVANADRASLNAALGPVGSRFHDLANARDPRPVHRRRTARSMGSDRTLRQDLACREELAQHLKHSADRVGRRLRKHHLLAGGIRVKLKTSRFQLLSRQCSLPSPSNAAADLYEAARTLLDRFEAADPYRMVGLAAFALIDADGNRQLSLFDTDAHEHRLEDTLDRIAERFGDAAIRRARSLSQRTVSDFSVNLDVLNRREI